MTRTRVVDSFNRTERVKYYTVHYKRYKMNSQLGVRSFEWLTVQTNGEDAWWQKRRDAAKVAKAYTKEHNVDTRVVEHYE